MFCYEWCNDIFDQMKFGLGYMVTFFGSEKYNKAGIYKILLTPSRPEFGWYKTWYQSLQCCLALAHSICFEIQS